LRYLQAMSFSSLRWWVNRSPPSTAGLLPNPLSPAPAEAQFTSGLTFAHGQGVAQDYVQAARCYTAAAEHGHSRAQLNLAVLYENGQGVARDQAKALTWLSKAANLGNADAQYRLGVHQHMACRTTRPGLAEGRIEALKWVLLSAAQKHHGAESACEFVALGMTREEVAESGRRVATFPPGPNA
jgi:TPR repeat protein